ncbi:acyl-CoA dehydrogenase family protein [Rhodococcus sp. HNM0569]|uniref:acyl-CoA dehydrogenase family protein n=1 Tax=Rhodococcus sp. HNM0569 TaxID=2716340 RepID=UPI00146DB436|nr:acyl-CoA dehydrogenase family protein [Rhodococcus sp. HNM0569]NLU83481.1 acyl-CoA/acyl-ACP dehydrogenase [Rhodococcus sp. HNM0569]
MDFARNEDLEAIAGLAGQIFGSLAEPERVVQVETGENGFDRTLWTTLAESGLLGIALPESVGGAEQGMLGLVALLEEQGKRVAPVPLWPVLAGAALPLAHFGSEDQISRWLPGLVEGTSLLIAAFETAPGQDIPVLALRKGDTLVVSGEIAAVPSAAVADGIVMPVRCEDGSVVVAVVPTGAAGLTVIPLDVTSHESAGVVRFDEVEIPVTDQLAGDGDEITAWVRRRLRIAVAALQLGVCEEALRMTAAYTSERVQFGRPLSTNQAVAVRAADAYLDTESIRLTTQRAAWLLDEGREDEAESASLVAKWWAARGGLRVVHATQHLHGGIGADVDYPIHRYFLWGRQCAFTLGSADAVAAELGAQLHTAPPIGAPT